MAVDRTQKDEKDQDTAANAATSRANERGADQVDARGDDETAERNAAVVDTARVAGDSVARPAGRTDVATPGRARKLDKRDPGPKVLNSTVHVRNPETGQTETLEEGSEVPDWATKPTTGLDGEDGPPLVGDHVLGDPDESADGEPYAAVPVPVDRSEVPSEKAGRPTWAAYASAHGVIVQTGASKADIVAALEDAGVPTK